MRTFILLVSLLLTACGFHMRGHAGMPFASLYLEASNPGTPFIAELRRSLTASNVTLEKSADKAEITLKITSESLDKEILSLSGSGRVNEFELIYRVTVRAYDNQQQDWIPEDQMEIRRNYSYDDTQILAKEEEEAMLVQSMRTDMVQQVVRRLSHSRTQPQ